MKILKAMAAGAATCAALLLAACGGGGGDGGIGGSGATAGTMKVSMTDAPSCGYDHVFVTVNKVRVHQSADAADAEGGAGGWVDVPLARPQRVDLLTLTNGVLFPLGETVLPAGKYQQMRLVLADNTAAFPLANSVQPTGGAEVPLDTPSGQQSGLKLNMNVDVPADKVVDVVLDFDACKSVVKRGNTGKYNLKPVIAVIPVACATYFPGLALLDRADPLGSPSWVPWIAPVIGPLFLFAALRVWNIGVRHYRSTGS